MHDNDMNSVQKICCRKKNGKNTHARVCMWSKRKTKKKNTLKFNPRYSINYTQNIINGNLQRDKQWNYGSFTAL